MEKKQSSIEWLVDQLDNFLELYSSEWEKIIEIKEKAKAMHKEEIEDAYDYMRCIGSFTNGKEYYNETFGGEDETN